MSQTSETSKIGGRTRQYIREHFFVSVERVPNTDLFRYRLRCLGCEAKCDLHFTTPGALSSASVARNAGVFYSLCKNSVPEDRLSKLGGQLLLTSDVNNGDN